jgi:hypothetical protein
MEYSILDQNELLKDINDLILAGLTEDEIEGYVEFFFDNYYPPKNDIIFH